MTPNTRVTMIFNIFFHMLNMMIIADCIHRDSEMARSGLLTNEVVFVRFLALPAINGGRGKGIKTLNKICV